MTQSTEESRAKEAKASPKSGTIPTPKAGAKVSKPAIPKPIAFPKPIAPPNKAMPTTPKLVAVEAQTDEAQTDEAQTDEAQTDEAQTDEAQTSPSDGVWANERLSAVEADALASAIRPSWEVDAGGWSSADAPPTNDASAPAAPQVTTGPSIVVDDEVFREVPVAPVSFDQDEDPILPVSRSPGKMLAILGGIAVVGVLVIAGSFMGGGGTETPMPQAAAGSTDVAGATAEPQPNTQSPEPQTPEPQPEANTQSPEPQAPEPQPEANTQSPEPQAPEPQPEAAPPQVHVSLRATPSGAQLTLDGEQIPNPYQAELPVDGRQHRVAATLEGYREATRTLGFDRDRNETLTLSAIPAPPPSMVATMSSRSGSSSGSASASRMSSGMAHGTARHRPSGMRGRGMRGRGMRGRHGAGFTSANPY